jgi:hypothetical protein
MVPSCSTPIALHPEVHPDACVRRCIARATKTCYVYQNRQHQAAVIKIPLARSLVFSQSFAHQYNASCLGSTIPVTSPFLQPLTKSPPYAPSQGTEHSSSTFRRAWLRSGEWSEEICTITAACQSGAHVSQATKDSKSTRFVTTPTVHAELRGSHRVSRDFKFDGTTIVWMPFFSM